MPSYTRQVAEFATDLKLSAVPADVIARAKSIILDGLGCGLFATNLKWTQILAGVVKRLEPRGGQASIWGRNETACAVNAALVNGTMVQGYELDDAHPAAIRSCAAVLPAVLGASEYLGAEKVDGEKLLTAIIAGFEVGPRVGLCMDANKMLVRGWHTPGIFSPFPAAIAAGIVLGLSSDQFYHALGIAGPQASGLMAAQFGSMVKRMFSAKGAQSGLYAALLAADGLTGIEDVFEEKYGGYCTTFSQTPDQFNLPALSEGLGTRWETMRIAIKPHASVGTNLAALDAFDELIKETGLKAADVDGITIAVTESALHHSGWSPYVPQSLTTAQMHMGFCVAMKLIDGEVFVDEMVEENIARPDLVELANRVKVIRSPEREQKGIAYARGADVEVVLKDRRTLSKTVDFYVGSSQRPMTDTQITTKFRRLASKSLSPEKVTELEGTILNLERASVANLVKVLQG
jgi:aconitate decarboxylase